MNVLLQKFFVHTSRYRVSRSLCYFFNFIWAIPSGRRDSKKKNLKLRQQKFVIEAISDGSKLCRKIELENVP